MCESLWRQDSSEPTVPNGRCAVLTVGGPLANATRIPAALAGGRADSRILQEFMAAFAQRRDTRSGRIDNMLKDLVAVETAASFEVASLRLTQLVTEMHRGLVGRGLGAADNAAYMRLFD